MKNIFADLPEENLGYLLSRVYAIRLKRMNSALAPLGVNYVQAGVLLGLYWLQMRGESVNQTMIIDNTRLDKSVVSNILREAERRGYVSRMESAADTRAKIVTLTPLGEALTENVAQTINQIDRSFWGDAPREEIRRFLAGVMTSDLEK